MATKIVCVQAGPAAQEGRVVRWELDSAHPRTAEFPDGGEMYVAEGGPPKHVALNGTVTALIRNDLLEEVEPTEDTPALLPEPRKAARRAAAAEEAAADEKDGAPARAARPRAARAATDEKDGATGGDAGKE